MVSESPITQVAQPDDDLNYQQQTDDDDEMFDGRVDAIPHILKLDLRGTRVDLEREALMNLPENLLIAMFPNGLMLNRMESSGDDDSQDSVGEDVSYVDFDPACLEYIRRFYQYAQEVHRNNMELINGGEDTEASAQLQQQLRMAAMQSPANYQLLTKQPIIVLREELEYYSLPKHTSSVIAQLKRACGEHIRQNDLIFEALLKNIARENNVAEQHLINMLCDAGFSREDRWGYRELEPTRTCVISMALVLLKTVGEEGNMAAAQKLLLFWRKPARKCWWDGNTVTVMDQDIRLWARRTWILELALV